MDHVTAPNATLAATLRAWRDRLSPAAVGLPAGHGRRAAGLRREELAELAGLSVDYLVRLEQGRATAPSAQVVASLARALQLTAQERDHLHRLANLVPPTPTTVPDHIPPGVHRLVSRLGEAAVGVFAADWQMLWWNASWAALLGDPSVVRAAIRNFARTRFPTEPAAPPLSPYRVVSDHEDETDAAVVADLRRASGRYPDDARLARLIGDLNTGNDRFAALWAEGAVGSHREDSKTVQHPTVGPIALACDTLTDGDLDLKIVVLTAAPGSEDETKLKLALVAGSPAALSPAT